MRCVLRRYRWMMKLWTCACCWTMRIGTICGLTLGPHGAWPFLFVWRHPLSGLSIVCHLFHSHGAVTLRLHNGCFQSQNDWADLEKELKRWGSGTSEHQCWQSIFEASNHLKYLRNYYATRAVFSLDRSLWGRWIVLVEFIKRLKRNHNFGPYLFCPVLQIFLPCLLAVTPSFPNFHSWNFINPSIRFCTKELKPMPRTFFACAGSCYRGDGFGDSNMSDWFLVLQETQSNLFQNGAETKVVPFTPLLCKRWCLTILEHRFDDFWWLQKLKLYLWGEGPILNNVNCLPSRYPAQNPAHQFKYFSQLGALVVHLAVPLGSAPNSGHLHRSKTWPGSFHSLIFWGWWPGGWPSWTSRPLWLSHWHTLGCQPSKWWYLNFAPHPKIHQNPPCQGPLEGCQGFGSICKHGFECIRNGRPQADWDEFDDPTTVMTSMQVSLKLGQIDVLLAWGRGSEEEQWMPILHGYMILHLPCLRKDAGIQVLNLEDEHGMCIRRVLIGVPDA